MKPSHIYKHTSLADPPALLALAVRPLDACALVTRVQLHAVLSRRLNYGIFAILILLLHPIVDTDSADIESFYTMYSIIQYSHSYSCKKSRYYCHVYCTVVCNFGIHTAS